MSYQIAATQRSYERIDDALAAMGDGFVTAPGAGIVAFHERHMPTVAAHVFTPNAQTGACRCGTLPLGTTRGEHAQHVIALAVAR